MHWEYPYYLLGLWLLPAVAMLLAWSHRRREAAAARFAWPAMQSRIMPSFAGSRPWFKGAALVLAIGLLIVAAAGPRYGAYKQKLTQRGADIFVLLDVSRSMMANDVAPSRLERAKLDIRDLLDRVGGDRVGLIVFAGKPTLKVPLTTDRGFFESVLNDVDSQSAPRGGTLIGDAIRQAVKAMPDRGDRDQAIVLITDGEDQESMPEEAAKLAAQHGIKIFTVALGDSNEGGRIPIHTADGLKYLKYAGQEHWSKVDEGVLRRIAEATGGDYIPVGTKSYDLGQVYENHLSRLARGQFHSEKQQRYHDRYQWFLALGVFLLLADMAVPIYSKKQLAAIAGAEDKP